MNGKFMKSLLNSRNKEGNIETKEENKKNNVNLMHSNLVNSSNEWYEKYKKQVLQQTLNNQQARLRQYYAENYDKTKIEVNTILYEVRDGTSFTDSPRSIFNYLINNKSYENYSHVIVYDKEHLEDFPLDELKKFSNVELVQRDTYLYMSWLLRANYLITNSTFRSSFLKKEGQVYINTWHGTPLKHMGDAYTFDPLNAQNVRRNFLMTDYLISPNSHTTRIFLDDYKLNGLWDGKILENGLPRNDLNQYNSRGHILKELIANGIEINEEKQTVVYMPTWTGTDVNDAKDVSNQLNSLIESVNNQLNNKINFLIKVHPFVYDIVKNDDLIKNYLIPNQYDSNEIFKITDCLITNYSSVFFDFLVTSRPIIFYNWDADIYNQNRGNYISEDSLPGPSAKNIEELLEYLKDIEEFQNKHLYKYKLAREAYVPNEDANMIEEYVSTIFKNEQGKLKVVTPENGKIKILIHPGALYDNGITSSFLNLVNQIDYSKYDVTAFLHASKDLEVINNLKKINSNVRKMYKPGLPIYTLDENIKDRYLKNDIPNETVSDTLFPEEGYIRESKRLFGDSKFDAVIDFSGYSYFWAKYLVVSSAPVKIAYMHNDLWAETNREVNGEYPLRNDLFGIFSLYSKFSKLVSVSKALKKINEQKLNKYIDSNQMTYVENSIDLDKIFSANKNTKLNNLDIKETNRRVFFSDDISQVKFYRNLDDIAAAISVEHLIDFSASYVAIYKVCYGTKQYHYIEKNNKPLGWTLLPDKKFNTNVGIKKVDIDGYISSEVNNIYFTLDDIIMDNKSDYFFEKYTGVKILKVLKINDIEYFGIQLSDSGIAFINAKFIYITSVNSNSEELLYAHTPNIFKNYLPYVKINEKTNKKVEIYLDNNFKKLKKRTLSTKIFFKVTDFKIKNKEFYFLISESDRKVGWINQKNTLNLGGFIVNEMLTYEDLSSEFILKQNQKIQLNLRNGNPYKTLNSEEIKLVSILDEEFIKGELYFNIAYKLKTYSVKKKDVNFEKLILKNTYIHNDPNDVVFVLSVDNNNIYTVLVDSEIRKFSKNQVPKLDEHINLLLDTEQEELFVTLKSGDIVWKFPYDDSLENKRVASTGMLHKYVFKTKNRTMNYRNSVFVDLYYNHQFVGWVNRKNIEISSYKDYKNDQLKKYPTEMSLTYYDREKISNTIFENDYNLYAFPNSLDNGKSKIFVNKEKNHFVDGEIIINNRTTWKRIVEENRIIGYLEWFKQYDKTSTKSKNLIQHDDSEKQRFLITSKKVDVQVTFINPHYVEAYQSQTDILKRNEKVITVKNGKYYVDKVVTFNFGKYVHVCGEFGSSYVSIEQVVVSKSFYLEALPEQIRNQVSISDTLFITMGRLSPEKNQESLIYAVEKLVKENPNVKLIILGKGPLQEQLTELIIKLDLQNNVFLAGQLENPFFTLSESDFFVFPSYWEGQPMVLLEALSLNKKIISSNIPQSAFVLKDGKYGLVSNGTDTESLADGMKKIMYENLNFDEFSADKYNQNAIESFYEVIKHE